MGGWMKSNKKKARDILKNFIGIALASLFPKIADTFFLILNRGSRDFYTYHLRPKFSKDFSLQKQRETLESLAIVIQGPLGEDSFVCETVRIYKKIFHEAKIVVSTWSDESQSKISELQAEGAYVIQNKKPKNRGISNINFQIVSTKSGVEFAKEKGALYVLKTRSDQRLYANNLFQYFKDILLTFPPQGMFVNSRLVGLSLNTFFYRMYGFSDMLMFGHVEDVLKFWNVKLDGRDSNLRYDIEKVSLREFAEWNLCEVYLTTSYLKAIGHKPKWTLQDSMDVYRKYFCILDKESVDLFWNKYTSLEFRWTRYNSSFNYFREITFKDWLRIYRSDNLIQADECLLDNRLN
jgi:hypothetical protein